MYLFHKEKQTRKTRITSYDRDIAWLYLNKTISGSSDMKRKVMMMSLAMVAGLPHAVHARNGNEDSTQPHASWNTAYMPHYGAEGAAEPLMDHVSVLAALPGRGIGNAWRLEFMPPAAASTDESAPQDARNTRLGFTLKLDF